MKPLQAAALGALLALAGCGLDSAGSAATGAAIKKQELESGKNALRQAQEKIDAAGQQVEASSKAAEDADK